MLDVRPILTRRLPWLPLAAGLAYSYGPVALNYGFALYFLTYAHGFTKRGLLGTLLLPIPHFSRAALLALQFTFLATAFAATYLVLRRLFFGSSEDRLLAALLFAGPALLPHFGFLFAQPDVTLYLLLLAILSAFLSVPAPAAAFTSTAFSCIALLVHEGFSLGFYPLIVAILYTLCRSRRLSWPVAAVNVALTAAAFAAILHFGRLPVSPDTLLADAAARTPVPLQRQVFDVMASDYPAQRALVAHFYRFPDFRFLLAATLALALPYFTLLTRLLRLATRAAGLRPADFAVLSTLFLLPLTLCWLGHDVSRWLAASAIDATLFLCFLALTQPAARTALRAWAAHPAEPLLWILWNLLTGPFGATGLHLAERLQILWTGP